MTADAVAEGPRAEEDTSEATREPSKREEVAEGQIPEAPPAEPEQQSAWQQAWQQVGDAVEQVTDRIEGVMEQVQDQIENAADAVRDAAVDALGLDDKFKNAADNTLDDIAPKAGDMVIEDAVDFIPGFRKLDDATSRDLDEEAKEACTQKILGFRERIHDFCEDVVEFLKEGCDMVGSALKCLYKVVSWILRACKEGVQTAVELLKKVIPDCCEPCCFSMCGLGAKLVDWVTTTFNKLIKKMVEDFIKAALRNLGVPEFICEKIDFNGNSSADDARDDDEPKRKQRALLDVQAEAPPQQEAMEGSEVSV